MGSSKRLLYVTQWFPPEPVIVPIGIAKALRNLGWSVEVLTGYPNYPQGVVQDGFDSRSFTREVRDGFCTTRTPLYASHDRNALRRMLNYMSWAATAGLVAPLFARRADTILVYSSPATAAVPAMTARVLTGRPFVLYAQDLWPESVTETGLLRQGRILRLIEAVLTWFVNLAYRMAAGVVVISPGAQAAVRARGVPAAKVHLIPNWADESTMRPERPNDAVRSRIAAGPGDFILMYAGTLGPAQALEHAIEAVCLAGPTAHLVLVGEGVSRESLQDLARRAAPGQVHFLPPVPPAEVAHLMAGADAQLVSLTDAPLFEITMPSKVQSILATGSLCIGSVPGDAARVIDAAGGLTAPPGDVEALAARIRQAASMTPSQRAAAGRHALAYYRANMSEKAGSASLSNVLINASGPRKGGEK